MYSISDDCRTAIDSTMRSIELYISVGTAIDTTSADDVTSITGGMLAMSNTAQASDAVYTLTSGLATYEGDGIPTADSAGMVCPPVSAQDYPPETGLWSDVISDADGAISWTLTIALSKDHTSGLTLYTDGPDITAATAVFTKADGTAATVEMDCSTSGQAQVKSAQTYSTIAITVTKISEAYHHARIAEVEYGASRALSSSALSGGVTSISELDPTEASLPMDELDFAIVNVDGVYDSDNPNGRLSEYAVGIPVQLAYTVKSSSARWTIPIGRYWIGERSSSDTSVSISAFDGRWFLSQSTAVWSISTGTSLGASIESLLSDLGIPHQMDSAVYDVKPDSDYTFADTTSCLEDLLTIEQAYGIYAIPQRDGTIRITQTWPTATGATVPKARILAYPAPQQRDRYNYVTIGYGENGQVSKDLRTDASEVKSVLSITGNPLIGTEARANAALERIAARVASVETETRMLADPAVDTGDVLPIPGRWTGDSPISYTVSSIETEYDGLVIATVRGYIVRGMRNDLPVLPDMRRAVGGLQRHGRIQAHRAVREVIAVIETEPHEDREPCRASEDARADKIAHEKEGEEMTDYSNILNAVKGQQLTAGQQSDNYNAFSQLMKEGVYIPDLLKKIDVLEKKVADMERPDTELFVVMESAVKGDADVKAAYQRRQDAKTAAIARICLQDEGFRKADDEYRQAVHRAYVERKEGSE